MWSCKERAAFMPSLHSTPPTEMPGCHLWMTETQVHNFFSTAIYNSFFLQYVDRSESLHSEGLRSLTKIMGAQTGLPAMQTSPKFIFFTDFDGTITLQDSE
jgi:hypothetical protein